MSVRIEPTDVTRSLRCYDCEATYNDETRMRCDCGEGLWFDVDADGFEWPSTSIASRNPLEVSDRSGIWRYADVLPAVEPVGLSMAVGSTPLLRLSNLEKAIGCRVSVKLEGTNPTGSFKDRGSAVGVSHAVARDVDWVGTVSHGNMARSVAAHAASAGRDCVVFVPATVPTARLDPIARHDPILFRVRGDYGRLYRETLTMARRGTLPRGISFLNSDVPLRIAGQKTVAYEICEAFAPSVPEAIVLPVSSGGNASAVWKALRELWDAGVLPSVPRLYLVQAAACDPIARAFRRGETGVTALESGEVEETVAVSIANADPPSGTRALAAVHETGGSVVSVDEGEIREATSRLASDVGLSVEPASAVAIAGLEKLVRRGLVEGDEHVVAVLTGTGYVESVTPETRAEVAGRTAEVDSLAERLGDVLESTNGGRDRTG